MAPIGRIVVKNKGTEKLWQLLQEHFTFLDLIITMRQGCFLIGNACQENGIGLVVMVRLKHELIPVVRGVSC